MDFQKAIRKGPNSFPGPDGISYWAWKRCADFGIATLRNVDADSRNGGEPAHNFNNSSMCFLVKGEDDHDSVAVLRDPMSTRPFV